SGFLSTRRSAALRARPDIRGCGAVAGQVYLPLCVAASTESGSWKLVRQWTWEMRFNLVDRILEVQPGKLLRAVKNLTLGEEYLADHFPTFPVMPGVLMLQTLVEAGAWLLRLTSDFK